MSDVVGAAETFGDHAAFSRRAVEAVDVKLTVAGTVLPPAFYDY